MGSDTLFELAIRWTHFLAGITWIGILYFFNFINVPFMKSLDAQTKGKVTPELMPRALWWFRYGALFTVLSGVILIGSHMGIGHEAHGHGGLFTTAWGRTIAVGGGLGLVMFLNVWVIIWPNQKRILEAARTQQTVPPQLAKQALLASRMNTVMSFPMLLFMAEATHFPLL